VKNVLKNTIEEKYWKRRHLNDIIREINITKEIKKSKKYIKNLEKLKFKTEECLFNYYILSK
jgi:hypothetical protein